MYTRSLRDNRSVCHKMEPPQGYVRLHRGIWEFPRLRGTILGVPIKRTIVFWGLYWGPLILGNYHITEFGTSLVFWAFEFRVWSIRFPRAEFRALGVGVQQY